MANLSSRKTTPGTRGSADRLMSTLQSNGDNGVDALPKPGPSINKNDHAEIFWALNRDGAGVRISALSSALFLSEQYGKGMRFVWGPSANKFHDLPSPTKVFSSSFLEKHHRDVEPDFWQWAHLGKSLGEPPWRAPTNLHPSFLSTRGLSGESLGTSLTRIGWSTTVMEAMSLQPGESLQNYDAVIHMRGGDILQGSWRHFSYHWKKIISVPILRCVLRNLSQTGQVRVAVLAQPIGTPDLSPSTGVEVMGQTRPELAGIESALHDISRLGSAPRIISGLSGFTVAASRISGAELSDFSTLVSPADLVKEHFKFIMESEAPGDTVSWVSQVLLGPLATHLDDDLIASCLRHLTEIGANREGVLLSRLLFLAKRGGSLEDISLTKEFARCEREDIDFVRAAIDKIRNSPPFLGHYGSESVDRVERLLLLI